MGIRPKAVALALLVVLGAVALTAWLMMVQPLVPFLPSRTPPAGRASAARIESDVRRLAGGFFPRDQAHPAIMARAADDIAQSLTAAGGRVSRQPFDAAGDAYQNVLASFGPEGGERVVVGAHYDTAGPQAGADDNASGVAGLIEIGRLLGARAPAAHVQLAAYALEEPPYFQTPLMGSAAHVAALRREEARVRAMICLEMIGYFDDAPGSQRFPLPFLRLFYPSRGNFIAVVGALGHGGLARRVKRSMRAGAALPVVSINAPRFIPGIDFSDHLNFWNAGYDAVMITDTAFYRNPHYHEPSDTPETLDYARLAQVVDGAHAAVRALAGG